jgi:hypothetical protein
LKIADPVTTTSTPAATASGGIGHVDPSVHLEAAAPRFDSLDHLARTPDLRERRVKEVRMSESAVHHHDQHLVEVLHDLLQNGRASRRVNGDADPFSQRFDALHGARQIIVALPVDQKRIGPGLLSAS